jgi:phosphoglycolate phosphatase
MLQRENGGWQESLRRTVAPGMERAMRLAVFDCDGTLVDSSHNIVTAMAETFTRHGMEPPPAARVRHMVGLSLGEAMAELCPAGDGSDHAALAATYKAIYQQLRAEARLKPEPMFDGIGRLLERLVADGWLLGVATGKSDRGLAHVLEGHGIRQHFSCLHTADRHPSKPDPAMLLACLADTGVVPARAVVIGDTVFDIGMGRAAEVPAIGVAWGYHPPAELLAAGASAVAATANELEALLLG